MAETAKILNPTKKVLLPDLKAGCSLADSCPPADFAAFKKEHPNHIVVSYVNTSAEIKTLCSLQMYLLFLITYRNPFLEVKV